MRPVASRRRRGPAAQRDRRWRGVVGESSVLAAVGAVRRRRRRELVDRPGHRVAREPDVPIREQAGLELEHGRRIDPGRRRARAAHGALHRGPPARPTRRRAFEPVSAAERGRRRRSPRGLGSCASSANAPAPFVSTAAFDRARGRRSAPTLPSMIATGRSSARLRASAGVVHVRRRDSVGSSRSPTPARPVRMSSNQAWRRAPRLDRQQQQGARDRRGASRCRCAAVGQRADR